MSVTEKDSYAFQKERLEAIAREVAPGKRLEFSNDSSRIKFVTRDPGAGAWLTEDSGEWIPSELADRSDDYLRKMVRHLSNGKLRFT